MKNETKELIKTMTNNDASAYSVVIAALSVSEEEFKSNYEQLSSAIKSTFSDKAVRKNIWSELNNKSTSYTEEKETVKKMREIIDNENELSKTKKSFLYLLLECTEEIIEAYFANPREQIPVKIKKLHPDAVIPNYAHIEDAGADVYAIEDVVLKPNSTTLIKLGFATSFSPCYKVHVVPRSGLSLKTKMRIANAPGTIEGNYRGEYGIIADNISGVSIEIKKGDRIAQLMIEPNPMMVFEEVDELEDSDRGAGGFGSSGING